MIWLKKVINVLFSLFSLMWAIVSGYGVYWSLSSVWNHGYVGMTPVDVLLFWLLMILMIVVCVSLVICAIRSLWPRSGQNNKKRVTMLLFCIILNAVGICLRIDAYVGVLLLALLGDVAFHPIIYYIRPILTSEIFCIITMLQMMTIRVFDEANGSDFDKERENTIREDTLLWQNEVPPSDTAKPTPYSVGNIQCWCLKK